MDTVGGAEAREVDVDTEDQTALSAVGGPEKAPLVPVEEDVTKRSTGPLSPVAVKETVASGRTWL